MVTIKLVLQVTTTATSTVTGFPWLPQTSVCGFYHNANLNGKRISSLSQSLVFDWGDGGDKIDLDDHQLGAVQQVERTPDLLSV
jgi:hypothetical protein